MPAWPQWCWKTTFIKTAASFIHSTSGQVLLHNQPVGQKTKQYISYLPDQNFLYPWFKVRDALHYFSSFFHDFDSKQAKSPLNRMGISPNQRIRSCSKGMQEKINIALAISRRASLFLFDEPLATVDPLTRDFIIDTIKNNLDRKHSSILISTHLINDVEALFDDVIILYEGKVLVWASVKELKAKYQMPLEEIFKEVIRHA